MAPSPGPSRGIPPPVDGLSAAQVAFPQTIENFDSDPRVSFSKLDNKYILEDDDGSEWEWQPAMGMDARTGMGRWVPSVDEALLERQRQAYTVAGISDEATTGKDKKRKTQNGNNTVPQSKKRKPNRARRESQNTAIYITSLPLDTDEKEVEHVFARCGLIAKGIDNGKPRVRLYTNEQGELKGDALVVYFRPESVQLAINLFDGAEFRLGDKGTVIHVKKADPVFKKTKYTESQGISENDDNNGASAEKDPRGKARAEKEKQKVKARTQEMNSKLADWDDDDPQVLPETSSRWDKMVVFKHMFTLEELAKDAEEIKGIEHDVRGECAKWGTVKSLVTYDREENGVITVGFDDAESAKRCAHSMNKRRFSNREVEAYISDGTEKFEKTNKKVVSDDDEEETRLDTFGDWLEKEPDEKHRDETR